MNTRILFYLLACLLCFTPVIIAQQQQQQQKADLTGTWSGYDTAGVLYFALSADGTYGFSFMTNSGVASGTAGTYRINGNEITFHIYPNGEIQKAYFEMLGPHTMRLTIGNDVYNLMRAHSPYIEDRGGIFGGNNKGTPPKTLPKTFPNPQQPNKQPGQQPDQQPKQQQPQRQQPNQQPGTINPQAGGHQPVAGATALPQMAPHQHSTGFSYQAPVNWTKEAQQNVDYFVPPDVYKTNEGPAEVAMVFHVFPNGTTDPLSLQVQSLFHQTIPQGMPWMQPAGQKRTPHGALYIFAGTSPQGLDMVGHVYIKIEKNLGLVTYGLSTRENMPRRDPVFFAMHSSCSNGGRAAPGQ